MTLLATVFLELGFVKVTKNKYWVRTKGLLHVIELARDRYGNLSIWLSVWHPIMAGQELQSVPTDTQSPVLCRINPFVGIDSNWCWAKDELIPLNLVTQVIADFFSSFDSLADIRNCLKGAYVHETFAGRLEREWTGPGLDIGAAPRYPVIGGALNAEDANSAAAALFRAIVAAAGFSIDARSRDLVATRTRPGPIVDCVKLMVGVHQCFFSMLVFPWTAEIWSLDRRLRGSYISTGRNYVETGGSTFYPLRDMGNFKVADFVAGIERAVERQARIANLSDLAAEIGQLLPRLASGLQNRHAADNSASAG